MDDRPLLNIGCGHVQPDGWTNVDPDPHMHAIVADPASPGGIPWAEDGEFRGAVANHVLMMVPWVLLVPWLREVRRVVDGPVRLSVPDIAQAIQAYHGGDRDWFPISMEHEESVDGAFAMYVTQAGATRSIFTETYLWDLCTRAGFQEIRTEQYGVCDWLPALAALDSRPHESLIVTAR